MRAAAGWNESQHLKVARFGTNMREVFARDRRRTKGGGAESLWLQRFRIWYRRSYRPDQISSLTQRPIHWLRSIAILTPSNRNRSSRLAYGSGEDRAWSPRISVEGGFGAFSDNFEDLHGITPLPGYCRPATHGGWLWLWRGGRLEECGIAPHFGRWDGRGGCREGTSFMEDYTYDFSGTPRELAAHMLEGLSVDCLRQPTLEVHPSASAVKPILSAWCSLQSAGPAVVACIVDMGTRFRMIANAIDVVAPSEPLPKLPSHVQSGLQGLA